MRLARGFTLIELLITVVILGIIASVALPSYTSYLTRSKLVEAHSMLADLRVKQEQRFQDARAYSAALCAPTGAAAAQVKYFDFACPAAPSATAFEIRATGKAGTDLAGIMFSINENNVRATVVTAGSKMADKGFASNASCWTMKKAGQC
jgi:type IV pilus assembly protein PilE